MPISQVKFGVGPQIFRGDYSIFLLLSAANVKLGQEAV